MTNFDNIREMRSRLEIMLSKSNADIDRICTAKQNIKYEKVKSSTKCKSSSRFIPLPTISEEDELEYEQLEDLHQAEENSNDFSGSTLQPTPMAKQSFDYIARPQLIWEVSPRWIVGPRSIVRLLNNAERVCNTVSNEKDLELLEQIKQFYVIIGGDNEELIEAGGISVNIRDIKARLMLALKSIVAKDYSSWLAECSKFKLKNFMTSEEYNAYVSLLIDHVQQDELIKRYHICDLIKTMMGSDGDQLERNETTMRFQLRMPKSHHCISQSFLLLTLGELGFYYNALEDQKKLLCQLGPVGILMASRIEAQLLEYSEFCYINCCACESFLQLFLYTRNYHLLFQWLLQTVLHCIANKQNAQIPLLNTLHMHLDYGNLGYAELVKNWLLEVCQPVVIQINAWITLGQLSSAELEEFFIVSNTVGSYENEEYWQHAYILRMKYCPPFFDELLAKQILQAGQSLQFCRQFLNKNNPLISTDFLKSLKICCQSYYDHKDDEPIRLLIDIVHQETGSILWDELNEARKILDLLQEWRNYLLLTDGYFVCMLMKKLEEKTELCNVSELNCDLQELLSSESHGIFIETLPNTVNSSSSWSRLLLRCKMESPWIFFLGKSMKRYEALFPMLWEWHHVAYVLYEHIWRHQKKIHLLLNSSGTDMLRIEAFLCRLLKKFLYFMDAVRGYMISDVIGSAFEEVKEACRNAHHIDDLLVAHEQYLSRIEQGLFHTPEGENYRQHLTALCKLVLELLTHQKDVMKFFQQEVSRSKKEGDPYTFYQFIESNLSELEKRFHSELVKLIVGLSTSRYKQFNLLALVLDSYALMRIESDDS